MLYNNMSPKKNKDEKDKGKAPMTQSKKTNLKKIRNYRAGNFKASSSRQLTQEQWNKITKFEKEKIDDDFTKKDKKRDITRFD